MAKIDQFVGKVIVCDNKAEVTRVADIFLGEGFTWGDSDRPSQRNIELWARKASRTIMVHRLGGFIGTKISGKDFLKEFNQQINPLNMENVNIMDKFRAFCTSEPEKTFIKHGLMRNDKTLSGEGQAVFLEWLLKENGNAFKAFVDEITKEDKKKKA